MKILSIDLKGLHTDESLGFFGQIFAQTNLVSTDADQEYIQKFGDAIKSFELALKPDIKNSYTEARKEADDITHDICLGLRTYSEAMTYYPEEQTRTVAKKVFSIIEKYGLITRMGYKELYPNLQALLIELKAIPEDISKLWMQVWVDSLSKACDNFIAITEDKIAEDAQKEVGIVQEKRTIADETYKNLINRINAGASYNGIEPYEGFINIINVIIEEYKAMLLSRKTRNANKKEEEKRAKEEENRKAEEKTEGEEQQNS